MKRKYRQGETTFTFSGVEGKAVTEKDSVVVKWCGRSQFLSTLAAPARSCVIEALFKAGLVVV